MNEKYNKCVDQWNEIFDKDSLEVPKKPETSNAIFDQGIEWLADKSKTVLDFGCGSGTILFLCAMYGTIEHIGIDLSSSAIDHAIKRSEKMESGEYTFYEGGIEKLLDIESESVDAVVLSNIIDNLYPDDAGIVLKETRRILRENGKVFIKLNPYITKDQINEYGIKVIEEDLLDDGLILWNNTNEKWISIITKYFHIEEYKDIYYPEYQQNNRMFLATK